MKMPRITRPWLHWYWGQVLLRNPHRTDYVDAIVKTLPGRQ